MASKISIPPGTCWGCTNHVHCNFDTDVPDNPSAERIPNKGIITNRQLRNSRRRFFIVNFNVVYASFILGELMIPRAQEASSDNLMSDLNKLWIVLEDLKVSIAKDERREKKMRLTLLILIVLFPVLVVFAVRKRT